MDKQNSEKAKFSYAWVILVVLFIGLVASFGMRVSIGAYITQWEQDFSVGRTMASSVVFLSFVSYGLGQPLAGKLNDIFGKGIVLTVSVFLIGISLLLASRSTHIWQLFLLYGVGFSVGTAGTSSSVAAAVLSKWFVEKRGLAMGLLISGMAIGQLILVPANLFLIDRFEWRTALATLSIIILVVVGPLFIFLLRSMPSEKGLKPYGYTESADDSPQVSNEPQGRIKTLPVIRIFKHSAFWYLAIPYFLCGFTDVGIINTHLIPMVQEKGFPITSVAAAFSLISAANIGGTILTGHLSDITSRKRQLAVIYGFRAITYIFLITLQQPWLLLIFGVLYGAVEMASIAPTQSLTVSLFEGYSMGTILGVISVSHQLGGAIGSWIPGLIYDLTGSYNAVLIFSIFLLCGAALLVLRVPEPDRKKT